MYFDITKRHVMSREAMFMKYEQHCKCKGSLMTHRGNVNIVPLNPIMFIFQGFGHLLPSFEDGPMLGVIYDSCTFPQHDRTDKPSTRFTVSHTSGYITFFGAR